MGLPYLKVFFKIKNRMYNTSIMCFMWPLTMSQDKNKNV